MVKKYVLVSLCILVFQASGIAASFKYSCLNIYTGEKGKYGTAFYLDAPAENASVALPKNLKIFSQNFENLGTFLEKFRTKIISPNGVVKEVKTEKLVEKTENQKIRLALRIKKQNPDIIVGTEVKDIEAARTYSRDYLNDEYQAILIEGNDARGIDVCFFVRRSLNLDFEVQSNKSYPGIDGTPVFSRDFPVLLVRSAGASKKSSPLMGVFATHLKSRMGTSDDNDTTLPKRTAQVLASLQIMKDLENQYPGIPIIMGGDFNNKVHKGIEFKPFFEAGLNDSMEIAKDGPPRDERYTQYFFTDLDPTSPGWELVKSQLDALFVNPALASYILSSSIQRDIRQDGTESPLPKDAQKVNARGSDHDGVVAIIDFEKLIKNNLGR